MIIEALIKSHIMRLLFPFLLLLFLKHLSKAPTVLFEASPQVLELLLFDFFYLELIEIFIKKSFLLFVRGVFLTFS